MSTSNVASSNIGELELEDSIIIGDFSLLCPRIGTFVCPGIQHLHLFLYLASSANATNTSSGDSSASGSLSGTVRSGNQSRSPPVAKVVNIQLLPLYTHELYAQEFL